MMERLPFQSMRGGYNGIHKLNQKPNELTGKTRVGLLKVEIRFLESTWRTERSMVTADPKMIVNDQRWPKLCYGEMQGIVPSSRHVSKKVTKE